MRKSLRLIGIALSIAAAAACSQPINTSRAPVPRQVVETPALPPVSESALQSRGALLESEPFNDIDPTIIATGATAERIVYQSTSGIDGSPVRVSGSVFQPAGRPPEGGWNIVSIGHGTTGTTQECGPSIYPNLLGFASTIASLMKLGVVAVMTDYQGLGLGDGQHRYLEPYSAAFNVIDGVRAAKAAISETSSKWAALGVSQGGQAVWAAAELADYYGTGLAFVGSVALAPAVDLIQIAELASSSWLTHDQQIEMSFLIDGFRAAEPDVDPDDYLHGTLASNRQMWVSCSGPLVQRRAQSVDTINPSDTVPVSQDATEKLKAWLTSIALPQRRASGPILVVNGGEDNLIRPVWVQNAVATGCELGDAIQHIVRPNQTHYNLDPGAETAIWLVDRFAEKPAPTDC